MNEPLYTWEYETSLLVYNKKIYKRSHKTVLFVLPL